MPKERGRPEGLEGAEVNALGRLRVAWIGGLGLRVDIVTRWLRAVARPESHASRLGLVVG